MVHFLYILFSKSKDSFYIGESHNVEERLIKHNAHLYNPKSFMKSKKFIQKIIDDHHILTDILEKR